MISYEVNLICDSCEDECFTSEPLPELPLTELREKAAREAEGEGWLIRLGYIYCPDCRRQAEHRAEAGL